MSKYLEALKLRAPMKYLQRTFKSHRGKRIHIDEWFFRLHYMTTVRILVIFTVIVSIGQFTDKAILCDNNSDFSLLKPDKTSMRFRKDFINTYCYIKTTFTIPAYINNSNNGIWRLGLDEILNRMADHDWESKIDMHGKRYSNKYPNEMHYAYYQWVPFFLIFEAITFFIPHYIWNHIENHKIKSLLQTLHDRDLTKSAAQQAKQIDLLGKYLWSSIDLRAHTAWTIQYMLGEVLNIIVLAGNIHLTNVFVNYEFTTYGTSVLDWLASEDPRERTDPISFVFPRVTKCSFEFFGPGATIQKADVICLLVVNMINEKVFAFLWFWYILLLLITSTGLVFRFASLLSVRFRMFQFGISFGPVRVRPPVAASSGEDGPCEADAENEPLSMLIQHLSCFDWILIRFIQMNLDKRSFERVLKRINYYRLEQIGSRSNTAVFK